MVYAQNSDSSFWRHWDSRRTEDLVSCGIHYITVPWLLGCARIPTFYWQPLHNPCSNTDAYRKWNTHTRTPTTGSRFTFLFTHYIYFSYKNFVQTVYKRLLLHSLIIIHTKCLPVQNSIHQKNASIISPEFVTIIPEVKTTVWNWKIGISSKFTTLRS